MQHLWKKQLEEEKLFVTTPFVGKTSAHLWEKQLEKETSSITTTFVRETLSIIVTNFAKDWYNICESSSLKEKLNL